MNKLNKRYLEAKTTIDFTLLLLMIISILFKSLIMFGAFLIVFIVLKINAWFEKDV